MTTFVRAVCLFLLAVWVGGIVFFGAVEAHSLFAHLASRDAGVVVASSLHQLHRLGIVAGVMLLLFLLLFPRVAAKKTRVAAIVLTVVMLGMTIGTNAMIRNHMEPLRAAAPNQDISSLAPDDPARVRFDAMHAWSTRLESIVLLAGFGLLACFAVRQD